MMINNSNIVSYKYYLGMIILPSLLPCLQSFYKIDTLQLHDINLKKTLILCLFVCKHTRECERDF